MRKIGKDSVVGLQILIFMGAGLLIDLWSLARSKKSRSTIPLNNPVDTLLIKFLIKF